MISSSQIVFACTYFRHAFFGFACKHSEHVRSMYAGIYTNKIIWITENATKISPMFPSTLTEIVCLLSVLVCKLTRGSKPITEFYGNYFGHQAKLHLSDLMPCKIVCFQGNQFADCKNFRLHFCSVFV